ncbi:MAG: hypothetical protein K6A39_09550 [Clostridiales bacterium]|nr:hypothetical protein [Clostridiales bacterium]
MRTVFIYTLGKAYLGINGLFSNILTMLSLTELGLDIAINYKLYKPLADGDEKRVRLLMKFYKNAYRIVGTAVFVLGLCLIPFLPALIKDYDSLAVLGVNATLIFILHVLQSASSYFFFAYRSAILKADQRPYIIDIASIFTVILTDIVKIVVLVAWKDFVLYTATHIVSSVFQNMVNAILAKHYYPSVFEKDDDSLSKQEIKEMLKDCGAVFVFKLNSVVLKATDNIVISAFIGLEAVGVYSNYLLFFTTLRTLFNRVYAAVKASLGNLFAVESIEKKYRFFQIMNYVTILLFGTTGIGLAVCADEFIQVWIGQDYVLPQPFAILIGIELLFHGLKVNLSQIRNVSGIFRQLWFRPVLGVIINIGVSIGLVFVCGIYGVIIGTITADLLTAFLVDPKVVHKYAFDNYQPVSAYYKKNLLYFIILIGIGFVDMWICRHVLIDYGWVSVIVHILIVSITVPGILTLIFWKTPENRYLISTGRKMMIRIIKKTKILQNRQSKL